MAVSTVFFHGVSFHVGCLFLGFAFLEVVVKVSQPVTVVCSSSGIKGVTVLKVGCTNSALMLSVFIPILGKHLFSAFVPLVLKICNNPGLYSDPALSAATALTLGKLCMIRYCLAMPEFFSQPS